MSDEPVCRNWQTMQTQNLLLARACGFESHHRHSGQELFCFLSYFFIQKGSSHGKIRIAAFIFDTFRAQKKQGREYKFLALSKSDPDENRTRVSAVKGRCLSRLTTGPKKWIMESGKWKVYQDHHTTISEILW